MLLDVPFIPDPDYAGLLADLGQRVRSVHFSLSSPLVQDARQRLEKGDTARLIRGLNRLPGPRKYVLMNGRVHAPQRYFDRDGLARTGRLLARMADEAGVRGVVFADAYHLAALAERCPETAARLEAVPSVNCLPDAPDKIFALLDMIGRTGFRPPSRLVLDRSLNRNPERLAVTAGSVRRAYPDMELLLMANEGCLYQCPYKPAHDAHIALVNEGLCGERTFALNRDLGCVRRMLTDPGALLASPFIRPEDQARYTGFVDGIKLCGRNRGAPFLSRAVTAYAQGRYEGNLLDLMDAMGDLADRVTIPNHALPDDFADRVAECDKRCAACGWCAAVMDRIAERTDPGLPVL